MGSLGSTEATQNEGNCDTAGLAGEDLSKSGLLERQGQDAIEIRPSLRCNHLRYPT